MDGVLVAVSTGATAGKVGERYGDTVIGIVEYRRENISITHGLPPSIQGRGYFNPAWFSIAFLVPIGRSLYPIGIVTLPFFCGCLNWQWLPRCPTGYHPSARINLTTSSELIFTASPVLMKQI
jgi:hypothetical protein